MQCQGLLLDLLRRVEHALAPGLVGPLGAETAARGDLLGGPPDRAAGLRCAGAGGADRPERELVPVGGLRPRGDHGPRPSAPLRSGRRPRSRRCGRPRRARNRQAGSPRSRSPEPRRSSSPRCGSRARSAAPPAPGGNRPRSASGCGGSPWAPRSATPRSGCASCWQECSACGAAGSWSRLVRCRNPAATRPSAATRGRRPVAGS